MKNLAIKYKRFDENLLSLHSDIYPQPIDPGHYEFTTDYIKMIPEEVMDTFHNILDVGCGQGHTSDIFTKMGKKWTGVTLGDDFHVCVQNNLNVYSMDFSFLDGFIDEEFDAVFSRHSLEHSPFPILTLLEWRRICRKYLFLVLPAPEYWGWGGKNHYSVLNFPQWQWLLKRTGWHPIKQMVMTSDSPSFRRHLHPNVIDRSKVPYPPTTPVEYWSILEKGRIHTE